MRPQRRQKRGAGRRGIARRAVTSDIPTLHGLANTATENRVVEDLDAFARILQGHIDQDHCWVWAIGNTVIGFATADTHQGTIEIVFVDPAGQGRGIGRALLRRACDDLLRAGHRYGSLVTARETRAETFYRDLGWREDGDAGPGSVRLAKLLR